MKKILVVDDNLFMRYHMKKIIEELNDFIVVGEATNGKEALEKLKELNPEIITLDLTMPVMDGIEFLEQLNKEKEKIKAKVIVVKGSPKRMAGRVLELYAMFGASGKTCVILCSSQSEPFFKGKEYAILGDRDEPQTLNANLFSALREYGDKADVLLCEGISAEGAGLAFMNRLLRAAGYLCLDADK